MVGNGGSNGFVRYDVMGVPVDKYGFAVASTVSLEQSQSLLVVFVLKLILSTSAGRTTVTTGVSQT